MGEFTQGYVAAVQNIIHLYPSQTEACARLLIESGIDIEEMKEAQVESGFEGDAMYEIFKEVEKFNNK